MKAGLNGHSKSLTVTVLREAFRNLHHFEALFEQEGIDTIYSDGIEINLWDLKRIYENSERVLSRRQHQAIEWFLVENHKESEVAEMMGISPDNPIGSYATAGIKALLERVESGDPDFRV